MGTMLERSLPARLSPPVSEVGCLLAGAWVTAGTQADRTGPWVRTTVSRARQADSDDVRAARDYARRAAKAVGRIAPASRADVLERAAALAADRRADIARLL